MTALQEKRKTLNAVKRKHCKGEASDTQLEKAFNAWKKEKILVDSKKTNEAIASTKETVLLKPCATTKTTETGQRLAAKNAKKPRKKIVRRKKV